MDVFLEKHCDARGVNHHFKHSYMNWRYLAPLCYVKLGDVKGALQFMERNHKDIVLHATGLSFMLAASFCKFKLGYPDLVILFFDFLI